jgi:hypothetical protein
VAVISVLHGPDFPSNAIAFQLGPPINDKSIHLSGALTALFRLSPRCPVAISVANYQRCGRAWSETMAFDRTAGGHRFDFSREVCQRYGMSREKFENHGRPRCKGKPPDKKILLTAPPDDSA